MKRSALFGAVLAALSLSAFAAGQPSESSQSQDQHASQAAAGGGKQSGMHDEDTVKQVQEKLSAEGHDAGAADGRMGPKTMAALKKYQQSKGMKATGQLDDETMSSLGIEKTAGSGASSSSTSGSAAGGDSSASKPAGSGDSSTSGQSKD